MELYELLAKLREEEEDSPLFDSDRDDHEISISAPWVSQRTRSCPGKTLLCLPGEHPGLGERTNR